jgi:NitT/TauT family transport system permease protein
VSTSPNLYKVEQINQRSFSRGDLVIITGLAVLLYVGTRLALSSPAVIAGPDIILSPKALPVYTSFSVGRMLAAYFLSLLFTFTYGRTAAYNLRARRMMIPLLDVLQSVPILSFLPVVLLSLSAILPQGIAVELSSILLIFTSQAWNLTFSWYQSLTTNPKELREASTIFHFNNWFRFKNLELPFGSISLIWNSVMSWAGGWFFLMAAETFTLGQRDFRLPGLGSYLQAAANRGNIQALTWGIITLVLVVVAIDQLAWRPLLAWTDRFKLEMVESDSPPTSWFYDLIHSSRLINWLDRKALHSFSESVDRRLLRLSPAVYIPEQKDEDWPRSTYLAAGMLLTVLAYGAYRIVLMLLTIPGTDWAQIGSGIVATTLRVVIALGIALAWTIPVGVAIGTNRRIATVLQPVVQITASVPATALFPAFFILLINLPEGLNIAAVLLMLLGTQWYLLFNVIAGAMAIPQDLKYTSKMLQVNGWQRWRTLILPALFPFIVTGAITASGGAWNASIIAEHVQYRSQSYYVTGIGALIARSTAEGNYPLLLAATLCMVATVVMINWLVWRRLYRLAEERYRLE